MLSPSQLSDQDLRDELKRLGFNSGPVSASTRSVMEKKLIKLRSPSSPSKHPRQSSRSSSSKSPSPARRSPGRPRKNADPSISPPSRSNSRSSSSSRILASVSPKTSPVVIAAAEQSDNELELCSNPKPKSVFRRTPTPPRPTLSAQKNFSPGRGGGLNLGAGRNLRGSFYSSPETADYDDESMETSRILAPMERRGSGGSSGRERRFGHQQNGSPIEKIKQFGAYIKQKTMPYIQHQSERGKYGTPGGRFSPVFRGHQPPRPKSSEIPKWLVIIFGSFTVVLALAYLFTAHQKTMKKMNKLVSDTVSDTANFVYNYAIFPTLLVALVIGAAFIIFFVYKKRRLAKEAYERKTMELVDRIADRVRASGDRGVAEQHLRDILLPPTRRSSRDIELWLSAVKFINTMDSRIRSESRLLNGVECNVWIWINSTDISRGWQGPIEKVSPNTSNTPIRALTRCLKLRGLVDDRSEYDGEIKKEIYLQLRPITPVHFSIHHGPNEPCVYMMFSELNDAKIAFDTFHTHWFRGNLVSVKYVRDERYAERFPEAVRH